MIKLTNRPTKSKVITSPFGPRWGTFHPGVDIAPLKPSIDGDELYSVAENGKVVVSKVNGGGVLSGYGYYSIIQYLGFYALYGHQTSLLFDVGDKVEAGQVIGYMGHTGKVVSEHGTGTHLHFGLYKGTYGTHAFSDDINISGAIDPVPYFNQPDKAVIPTSNPVKEVKPLIIVPTWAKVAWDWATSSGINDGKVESEEEPKTMCYIYRLYEKFIKPLVDRIKTLEDRIKRIEDALKKGGLM